MIDEELLRSLGEGLESLMRDLNKQIDHERDQLQSHVQEAELIRGMKDEFSTLRNENAHLRSEVERLRSENEPLQMKLKSAHSGQLQAEQQAKALRAELAVTKAKFTELNKMAQKAANISNPQELQEVAQKYLQQSRRKSIQKKGYIRMVLTEMLTGVELNGELKALLEGFDDEEAAPAQNVIQQLNMGDGTMCLPDKDDKAK